MRVDHYLDNMVSGHNTDFVYELEWFKQYTLMGILSNNDKIEIELSESFGECGSGYTTASFGHMRVCRVKKFSAYNMLPVNKIEIDDVNYFETGDIYNELFTYSSDGGDEYYPMGFITVNEKLFKPTKRYMEVPPTYLFQGESGVGKSTLAAKTNSVVFETDSFEVLPDNIMAEIIVLGNKYDHTIQDIMDRVKNKLYICDFYDVI